MALIFFDTEFTGLKKDTNLLSIGLISEDDKKFYAELPFNISNILDQWLIDNVINNMEYKEINEILPMFNEEEIDKAGSVSLKADKKTVMRYLSKWFSQFDKVELVSDVAHYDMVLLIDIFGSAFDLPSNVCPSCYDINQDIARYKNIDNFAAFDYSREGLLKEFNIELNGEKHNALYDARVIRELYFNINK